MSFSFFMWLKGEKNCQSSEELFDYPSFCVFFFWNGFSRVFSFSIAIIGNSEGDYGKLAVAPCARRFMEGWAWNCVLLNLRIAVFSHRN